MMKHNVIGCRGFSLIELLVASSIMAVTVVAVISLVRKSREIQLVDKHRQEVRAILNARFEEVYRFTQYEVIPIGSTDTSVVIDERDGNPLGGTMKVSVERTTVNASGTTVPVKKVVLTMVWNESDDEWDTITMSKWVAE